MTSDKTIRLTIFGEPASKANSRRLTLRNGKPAVIKSTKAMGYVNDFLKQSGRRPSPLFDKDQPVDVYMKIFYASRRPDLDESLILDCLQEARIYANDRQVRRKVIEWGLDPVNPRAEICVTHLILDPV